MYREREEDGGFTLIEVIVAMSVATVILSAILAASISSLRASTQARIDQQAGDLLTTTLEDIRSMDFAAVAMAPESVLADSSIGTLNCEASNEWLVPNDVGCEPVVTEATGAISPHITTVDQNTNNATFTLKRYITDPGEETSKRATAIVEWRDSNDTIRSRTASTIVTNSRRGLPLPAFTITYSGGGVESVNPGGDFQLPFIIKNLGARDAFKLTIMREGSADTVDWGFYPDENCSGERSSLVPYTSDITPDLFPDTTLCFVAVATPTLPDGISEVTYDAVVHAKSVKQPTAETAEEETDLVNLLITTGVIEEEAPEPVATNPSPSYSWICTNLTTSMTIPNKYSLRRFQLLNTMQYTGSYNEMAVNDCLVNASSSPYTSMDPDIGQVIQSGGDTSGSDTNRMVEWRWLAPRKTDIDGQATLKFWYTCAAGGTSDVKVSIGTWNNSKSEWDEEGNTTQELSCTGSWRSEEIYFTYPGFSLNSNDNRPISLAVRLAVVDGNDLRINYDAPEAPSTLFVATKE